VSRAQLKTRAGNNLAKDDSRPICKERSTQVETRSQATAPV
jgi:hypothetical protein